MVNTAILSPFGWAPCVSDLQSTILLQAGQPFCVYVVMPMYPEGIPTSNSVQAILYYQTTTIRAMYKRIAEALRECGVTDRFPTDYLQFYCLGNREPEAAVSLRLMQSGSADRWLWAAATVCALMR